MTITDRRRGRAGASLACFAVITLKTLIYQDYKSFHTRHETNGGGISGNLSEFPRSHRGIWSNWPTYLVNLVN
eukprot:g14307.t1